mmetsp:Transcript_8031/g.17314  ORF Transcript_8031/g.17314 Transcript_8031/m.17314 type:complete len:205 (-) Transcript_8031:551-1165(-)
MAPAAQHSKSSCVDRDHIQKRTARVELLVVNISRNFASAPTDTGSEDDIEAQGVQRGAAHLDVVEYLKSLLPFTTGVKRLQQKHVRPHAGHVLVLAKSLQQLQRSSRVPHIHQRCHQAPRCFSSRSDTILLLLSMDLHGSSKPLLASERPQAAFVERGRPGNIGLAHIADHAPSWARAPGPGQHSRQHSGGEECLQLGGRSHRD